MGDREKSCYIAAGLNFFVLEGRGDGSTQVAHAALLARAAQACASTSRAACACLPTAVAVAGSGPRLKDNYTVGTQVSSF